ncbi:glycosyltransferase family 4 protein [Sphingomonas sp. PAMC 26621]|uniref:glycosyltransferase family 4 protein n=1 Tax=Sphingomonas sp. PAMC 26621 TaxID=1112213 RepID=UPI0002897FCC|nr:glycosyltransferase family 1 protein [Sphingomonas sp. PAMC 26621]
MTASWRDELAIPICVDARMLEKGGTGVSSYARSLAAAIALISDQPYRLLADHTDDGPIRKNIDLLRRAPRNLRTVGDAAGLALSGRDIFRRAHIHFGVHRTLYPLRCDLEPGIMHWTYPVPMRIEGWINIYTVHDAIPLVRPDLTSIDPRRHRAVLDAIVASGDGITTVSQDARAAIIASLKCTPDFVTDTGQPVDIADLAPGPIPEGLVPQGYFLMVGSVEPRKNVAAVLAAYRRAGVDLPLVVAGPNGWRAEPILADIARTPGTRRIPYLERATLLGLIANARALVFPSLAEGFGLPLVEAMALGTPVLTSDRGALAEVAGGAALAVDPNDVAGIAGALADLAGDTALRKALVDRGHERVAAFSQDRFVVRLLQLYRDTLQARGLHGNAPAFHR